jgi:hypothetical protein
MGNISEPYDNPFWEKSKLSRRKKDRDKEKKREQTPLIMDT